MTPDERELILDFFSRVAEQGAADKDRAAEALIGQELRRNPDAAYLLVQTAIVYEHQLAELEDRVRELEQQLAGREAPDAVGGGSFLGGRLGQPRAMVRNEGAGYGMPRPGTLRDHDDDDDRDDDDERPARSSPWSQTPGPAQSDGFRGAPQRSQSPRVEIREPVRAQAAGGGFLRAAMATAAGVAGGLMLGESLKGLLGGEAHAGDGQKSGDAGGDQQGELNEASDEAFFDDGGGDGGSLDI